MKLLTRLLAASAVLTLSTISSMAQTVGPLNASPAIASQLTDWSGTLSFPKFNPALGTLDSVTLDFTSTLTTMLTVQNTSQTSTSRGTVNTEMTISIEDAGNNFLGNDPQLDINGPTYTFTLAHGAGATSGLLTESGDSGALTYTLAALLSEFTGSGDVTLGAYTYTDTDLSFHGGNTSSDQISDAGLSGTVEYNYTIAPRVPPAPDATSTFGLLAMGLGAMPFFRRKRQQQ